MSQQLGSILTQFTSSYAAHTPKKIQLIDSFLAFCVFTGVAQFVYLLLAGQFPFNSFLAGFIASVGLFIFTVNLRLQVTNSADFHGISQERAYADFVVCNLILFFVVVTFLG